MSSEIPVVRDLREALQRGPAQWPSANAYEIDVLTGDYGRLVMFYLQGVLMAVWHIESGFYGTVPVLLVEDEWRYSTFQNRFKRAVDLVRKEMDEDAVGDASP